MKKTFLNYVQTFINNKQKKQKMQEKNLEHQIETVVAFSNTFTFETIPALVAVAKEMRSKNKLQGQLSKVVFDNYPFDYFKAKEHGKNSIEIAIDLLTPGKVHPMIEKLFKQLEFCNYECEGGVLQNNTAFKQLKTICSKIKVEGTLNEACQENTPATEQRTFAKDELNMLAEYLKENFPFALYAGVDNQLTPVELAIELLNKMKQQSQPDTEADTEIFRRVLLVIHEYYCNHFKGEQNFEEWLERRGLLFEEDRFKLFEEGCKNDVKHMTETEQSSEGVFQLTARNKKWTNTPDDNLNVTPGKNYEIFVKVHKNGSISVCRSEDFQSGVNVYDSLLLFMKHWSVD